MDGELRKFSANGNFNFKKWVSQSHILLTYVLEEGIGSYWRDSITRKAVLMVGVGYILWLHN